MEVFLQETPFLDYSHENFTVFLEDFIVQKTQKQTAILLYEKVRDAFLYDTYHLHLTTSALQGSYIHTKKRAWCVEKAIVLAACARRLGIPARLGYAIVVNHIGVEKLTQYLRRPEIVFHGYVELFIENRWVKCTPSFDRMICRITGVPPLLWDGENDSLFQAYSGDTQFMEYVHDYGVFEDVPLELMKSEMRKYYPHLFEEKWEEKEFSFKF